jgi:hypothetical protein
MPKPRQEEIVYILKIVNNLCLWQAIVAANLTLLMQSVRIEAFGSAIISRAKLDPPDRDELRLLEFANYDQILEETAAMRGRA